jgi:NAD-dependent SIR2 family protein deacetylase
MTTYTCPECHGFLHNWICRGCGADWPPETGDPGDEYIDLLKCLACGEMYPVDYRNPPDKCPFCDEPAN